MKRTTLVVLAIGLIVSFIFVPVAYGFSVFYTVTKLQFGIPTLGAYVDGLTVFVTLSIPITNNEIIPVPTLNVLAEAKLNDYVLFHNEMRTLETLNSGDSCVVTFTVAINFGLVPELFNTLVLYVQGGPVEYRLCFAFSVNLFTEVSIYEKTISGVFELY